MKPSTYKLRVFYLCIPLEIRQKFVIFEKKNMKVVIDKPDYVIVKKSYGYYTDNEEIDYPFSVEVSETNGEQKWIEISWDDDVPTYSAEVEQELMEIFVGYEK